MDPNIVASLLNPDFESVRPSDQTSFFVTLSKMITSFDSPTSTMSSELAYSLTNEKQQPILSGPTNSNNNNKLNNSLMTGGDEIPFDSPLDQSMGSPASTRDFSSSPFHEYEFDFSGVQDAIMFPDHGTQQMHNDNYLSGVPLFGEDYSQQIKQEVPITTFPTPSQQKEEHDRFTGAAANTCDFSFDAMTHGAAAAAAATTMSSMDVSEYKTRSTSPSVASSQGSESINQLAAVFVREYARTHALNDIDVLLRALQGAGIDVSDEVVTDILAAASFKSSSVSPSPVSSPASSQDSSCGHHQHHHHQHVEVKRESISPSVSPMVLPSRGPSVQSNKTRSSLQTTSKEQIVIDTRYGKRFVCSICNKQFDRAFNLRTHAMTHIDPEDRDKPFMCPWSECAKGFSRKYDAERHYRSVHIKKGEVATKKQVELALSGRHGHAYSDDEDDSPSNG